MNNLYKIFRQNISQLVTALGVGDSSIDARMDNASKKWIQSPMPDGGYVHLSTAYWGHGWGILLALDSLTGQPLYLSFINSDSTADYKEAVRSIEGAGYQIKGIVIEGKKCLFKDLAGYEIQMCQTYMKKLVTRHLTKNPYLKAARALMELVETLTNADGKEFMHDYEGWKSSWHDTLYKTVQHKDGSMPFIHRRLRNVMHRLDFYLPYLFTYQRPECAGMPNTNNKIKGIFSNLRNSLQDYKDTTEERRRQFIIDYFKVGSINSSNSTLIPPI